MSRSSNTSRSTSSYSSDKVPLSCQSDSRQGSTYGSYYPTTLSDPRYASSTSSSSSKSGRSKSSLKPLSISQGGSSSRAGGNTKANDGRYYPNSVLDSRQPKLEPLSCQKGNDERYYKDSSYYR